MVDLSPLGFCGRVGAYPSPKTAKAGIYWNSVPKVWSKSFLTAREWTSVNIARSLVPEPLKDRHGSCAHWRSLIARPSWGPIWIWATFWNNNGLSAISSMPHHSRCFSVHRLWLLDCRALNIHIFQMRKLRPRATHMELSLESNSDSALATLESAICCLLQQMGWRTGSLSSREWDGGSPGGLHWGHLLEHCVLLEQQAVSFHRDPLTICTCMTPKKRNHPTLPRGYPQHTPHHLGQSSLGVPCGWWNLPSLDCYQGRELKRQGSW